jgi:hypothetical protein
MRRIHRHLGPVTFAVVALYAAVVTVGALRGCWGTEHTHAGAAAPECPMHHTHPAHAPQFAHHDHGGSHEDGSRMVCRCSNDPTTPYLIPSAIVARPPSILPAIQTVMLPPEGRLSYTDARFSPPAPPPRATLFL